MRGFLPWISGTFLLLAGCGGDVSSEEPAGTSGAGGASSSTTSSSSSNSTSSGAGGGTQGGCPSAEPAAEGACSSEGLRCSYGESVVPECRRGYRCLSGSWQVDGLGCGDGPADCGTATPPDGAECFEQQALCVSGESLCVCGPCGGAGCPDPPWGWSCGGSDGQPGCPAVVPNDGTACASPGAVCHYGVFCASEASVKCLQGTWIWDPPMACP